MSQIPNPYQQTSPNNPYSHPAGSYQHPTAQSHSYHTNIPIFCMVMFIVSLFFSVLRVLMVAFGILGYVMMLEMEEPPPVLALALPEIISGIAIAIFGILGNSLMIAKMRIGFPLGCALAVAVAISIVIGGFQTVLIVGNYEAGSPEYIGAWIGAVFSLGIRVGILAAYVFALFQFHRWSSQQPAAAI